MRRFLLLLLLLPCAPLLAAPSLDVQLLDAAQKGDLKTTQTLVRKGARINARNERKQTPLMLAAMQSNERLVRFLLAKGANVRARDDGGFSVVGYGPNLVALLLKHGAKATPGDREWLSDCLENEVWIDSDLEDADVKAHAKLFLRAGMKLNASGFDENGTTPLLNAVDSRPSLVPFLLGLGADPNVSDKMGRTPLLAAMSPRVSFHEANSLALLLLKRGARPNTQTQSGETPLMMAAGTNQLALVKELLRRGAHSNLADKRGETALMRAARGGFVEVARLLLASGADRKSKNAQGQTAMDYSKIPDPNFPPRIIGSGKIAPKWMVTKDDYQKSEQEHARLLRGQAQVQAMLEGRAK